MTLGQDLDLKFSDIANQFEASAVKYGEAYAKAQLAEMVAQEATTRADAAQARADEAYALAVKNASGNPTAAVPGGYGPSNVAFVDSLDSVKNSVRACGGLVLDGASDASDLQNHWNYYQAIQLLPGTGYLKNHLLAPSRGSWKGSGALTNIKGSKGLKGEYILIQGDHVTISDTRFTGGTEEQLGDTLADGTKSPGVAHIRANVPEKLSDFITGEDACFCMFNIISSQAHGDGVVVEGFNARDTKVHTIHVHDAAGRGYFLNSPDGKFYDLVSGSSGSHGLETGNNSANLHISGKFWYSGDGKDGTKGDGIRLGGSRHTLNDWEAQDNDLAGLRVLGNLIRIGIGLADSNSFNGGQGYSGRHSGVEIGLLPATSATAYGSPSGGFNIKLSDVDAWDKGEGSRKGLWCQKNGITIRSGVAHLNLVNIQTGSTESTATHRNLQGGVVFLGGQNSINSSTVTLSSVMSHGVELKKTA